MCIKNMLILKATVANTIKGGPKWAKEAGIQI